MQDIFFAIVIVVVVVVYVAFDIVNLFYFCSAFVAVAVAVAAVLHDAVRMCWCSLQLALSKLACTTTLEFIIDCGI